MESQHIGYNMNVPLDCMKELRERMTRLRNDESIPNESRDFELLRLFDLHNELDKEIQRQYEENLSEFIQSLELEEINAVPVWQSASQCRIDYKPNSRKGARAISLNVKGVMENQASFPGYNTIKRITPQTAKDIADMQSRRKEMLNDLVLIERKQEKTEEDLERRNQIIETLKMQQERIKGV